MSWPSAREIEVMISKSVFAEPGGSIAGATSWKRRSALVNVPGLLEERGRRQDHVGVTSSSRSRRCPGRRGTRATRARWTTCVVFGSVCATSSPKIHIAFRSPVDRGVEHLAGSCSPSRARAARPRPPRSDCATSSSSTGGRRCRCPGSAPMSEEPWTLFCPRSGSSAEPGAADLAGHQREVADQLHDLRAVLVLGHAETPEDRGVRRPRRRCARPPRCRRRGRR